MFRPPFSSRGFLVRMNSDAGRELGPTGVLDEVAGRAAQVVGQVGTGHGGVGTIGDLACSHVVIEADLWIFGKEHWGSV